MKFSEHWLKQFVNTRLPASEIAGMLTFAGLEVDGVEHVRSKITKIVVGKIVDIKPHPKADRLKVCQVNVGKKKLLQIVCGASNAEKGLKVPTALVGASYIKAGVLEKIVKTQIREIDSFGMLCSAAELGIEDVSKGLLVLDKQTRVGADISDILPLDDHVVDVDLTPNRGDCLSVLGIAREMRALTGGRMINKSIPSIRNSSKKKISVSVTADKLCPRYTGRVIENINPEAITPAWMQLRLTRSGLRSLGPVVDVTNYVMLEMGQPMHGFDLDKISGGIKVISSKGKQKLDLLDDSSVTIPEGTLLIADKNGPLAIAGIMGGNASAVTSQTKNIFLESAFFTPDAIAGKARTLGKHTDSSHRFERGVDPGMQRIAIERATELLLAITGGEPGPIQEKISTKYLPKAVVVKLSSQKLESVLGVKISPAKVTKILQSLGMKVQTSKSGWAAVPPSYRFDIKHDVDLIEEIIRVYGYDKIPEKASSIEARPARISEKEVNPRNLSDTLASRGYLEVVTYSFIDKNIQELFSPDSTPATLVNPISESMSAMRTSLWPGLITTVIYNQNRQQTRLRFFETGHCFFMKGKTFSEKNMIAGVVTGQAWPVQWGVAAREVDFYDMKGDLEALLSKTGDLAAFQFITVKHPALHPGKTAAITSNGKKVGLIGQLHPKIAAKLGIETTIILFEIDIFAVLRRNNIKFQQISKYPSIRRDISILVDESIEVKMVFGVISQACGKWLVNLELFDEYRGEGIDSGRKSLSLGLTLQESSRTLKEEEVETVMARVIAALEAKVGARLR